MAEEVAALLSDLLPPDWRDELAIQARQEHLAVLAYAAADAAAELILREGEARRRNERLTAGSAAMQAWLDALFALDRGWRRYTHDTQRSDAGAIVYEAAEGWGGASLALFVEGGLDLARTCKRRAVEESGLALTRPMGVQRRAAGR